MAPDDELVGPDASRQGGQVSLREGEVDFGQLGVRGGREQAAAFDVVRCQGVGGEDEEERRGRRREKELGGRYRERRQGSVDLEEKRRSVLFSS